eukprot:3893026-Amphidinium_carterae.1
MINFGQAHTPMVDCNGFEHCQPELRSVEIFSFADLALRSRELLLGFIANNLGPPSPHLPG